MGALAVLARTMSSSWPDATSTMPVDQALVLNRPRRHMSLVESQREDICLAASASMSAPPQRRTDALTGCQLHPSSEARSLTGRPRPAWRVAQRPARAVSRSRGGAISRSCSVTVPAGHPRRGQRHRRLCNTSRAGRPNAGRSTNSTGRSPSDHNRAPQSPQSGLGPRRRMWTPSGSPASSSTPRAQSHQSLTHTRRVALHRDPPVIRLSSQRRFWPSRSAADPHSPHSDLKREEPPPVEVDAYSDQPLRILSMRRLHDEYAAATATGPDHDDEARSASLKR